MGATAVAGLNLRDYSRNAQAKGWGAACSGSRATVQLAEARVTVDVRIAELVGLIMLSIERDGYMHRKADTGAYNCRKIAGTSTWSNHAWAIAIDVNWQSNPYTLTLKTDIPVWARDRWNRYGFAWGGDYSGRKDAMHFEFMGTPAQALVALALARAELGTQVSTPVPPSPTPTEPVSDGWTDISMGQATRLKSRGEQVRRDQADLIDTGFDVGSAGADGLAGDSTVAAIRTFQGAAGLSVDGVMGDDTRGAIHKVPSWSKASQDAAYARLRARGWRVGNKANLTAFQREKGLVPDGVCGPITWTALYTRPL